MDDGCMPGTHCSPNESESLEVKGFYPCGVFTSSLGNFNVHPDLGGNKMNSLNLFCYIILAKYPLIKQSTLSSFSLCQSPIHSSTGGC